MNNKGKNVLFIGAGASYGAREFDAVHERPPLGNDLLEWIEACCKRQGELPIDYDGLCHPELRPEAFKKTMELIVELKKEHDSKIFEKIITNLQIVHKNDEYIEVLHKTMFALFTLNIPVKKDFYHKLIQELKIDRNPNEWVIVSLNYDVLCEQALESCGLNVEYAFIKKTDENSNPKIMAYKPYGCMDFYDHRGGHGGGSTLESASQQARNNKGSQTALSPNIDKETRNHYQYRDPYGRQIYTPYSENKAAILTVLENIQIEIRNICRNASYGVIIGVKPDDKDILVSEIFNQLCQNKKSIYVSMEDDCQKIGKKFPLTTLYDRGFQGYLNALNGFPFEKQIMAELEKEQNV